MVPLLGAIAPHVSTFMSCLIAPLITGVANQPNSDPYKDNLIKRFTSHTFEGTPFQNSKAQEAFNHNIQEKQYGIAISNMRAHQTPLNIDNLYPENGLGHVKNSVFYSMSRAIDSMITQFLVEFNKVQSRFLGAAIDQSRLVLESQNKNK